MGNVSITIVVPAFNEAERLPTTLQRLRNALDDAVGPSWEIIISDDGSTDATAAIVAELIERDVRIRLIRSRENRGKGAALIAGFEEADGDIVFFLDADLPVEVESLASFVGQLDGADIAIGSRRLAGSSFSARQPVVRRIGAAGFLVVVRVLGLLVTTDPQCGVKALRRARFSDIVPAVKSAAFGFDIELILRAASSGRTVAEVPVRWTHVEGSSVRPFRDGLATIGELIRLRRLLRRS